MIKKSFEFATRFSDFEKKLEIREEKELVKIFKVCRKCGERKSKSSFSKDKRSAGGRINICKVCRSKESLEYYYQNRDKILIRSKEYQETNQKDRSLYFEDYRKKHKEQLKKNAKKWYKSNKKKIKKRNLKYYQENKEACQARRELWLEKNKEKIKKYNREYKRNLKAVN